MVGLVENLISLQLSSRSGIFRKDGSEGEDQHNVLHAVNGAPPPSGQTGSATFPKETTGGFLDTHAIDARSHHGWPNSCGAVHQGEAGPQARSAANRFSLTDSRRECRRSTPRVPKSSCAVPTYRRNRRGVVFQRNAPGRSVTAPAHRPRAVTGPVSAHASSPCPIRCGAGCPRRGIPWAPCSGRSGAGNAGPVPRAPGSRPARAR